jgi:hypothetical protein
VPWNRVEPTAASITVEGLTGVWYISLFGTYLELNEDGTYGFADTQQLLEEAPFDAGQFQLEGTLLTFITNDESEFCTGQTGSYEIEVTEEDQLEFVLEEDPCLERRLGLPADHWDWVEPPAASITVEDLIGMWKDDDGPDFLQLNGDGTYAVAPINPDFLEKAPVEIGEFRLEGTSITYMASSESAFCTGQTGSYQVELIEEGKLQFELQEDACQVRADSQPGSWSRYEP